MINEPQGPVFFHGVNIVPHIRACYTGESIALPSIKVLRRSRVTRRIASAFIQQRRLIFNECLNRPNYDGFDAIETTVHEVAHLLSPWDANHGPVWQRKFTELSEKVYGVTASARRIHVGEGNYLAYVLRDRAKTGSLRMVC